MTLNAFMGAITGKLNALWPNRRVYAGEIPRGADGNFYIHLIESRQDKHLDRRRRRTLQFEVLYCLRSDDSLDFNEWAEDMYDNFETLIVEGEGSREVKLTNCHATNGNDRRVYQFLFDADFFFLNAPADEVEMGNLEYTEEFK